MRIYSQWEFKGGSWGIALLNVYRSDWCWGFVIFGVGFEFDREKARQLLNLPDLPIGATIRLQAPPPWPTADRQHQAAQTEPPPVPEQ